MLEQFVAVMPGTLAPALLVMSLSVMLTVGEGRDKPISSHWRLIGLIVGLIAAIVFAGPRASQKRILRNRFRHLFWSTCSLTCSRSSRW